jgi:hypothetical protein
VQDASHDAFSIIHSSMLIISNVTPSSCSIWRHKLLTLYRFIVDTQICIQQNPNLTFSFIQHRSKDNIVSRGSRLQAGHLRKYVLIPSWEKEMYFPPSFLFNGYWELFSLLLSGGSMKLTTHLPLEPEVKNYCSYTSTPPNAFMARTGTIFPLASYIIRFQYSQVNNLNVKYPTFKMFNNLVFKFTADQRSTEWVFHSTLNMISPQPHNHTQDIRVNRKERLAVQNIDNIHCINSHSTSSSAQDYSSIRILIRHLSFSTNHVSLPHTLIPHFKII